MFLFGAFHFRCAKISISLSFLVLLISQTVIRGSAPNRVIRAISTPAFPSRRIVPAYEVPGIAVKPEELERVNETDVNARYSTQHQHGEERDLYGYGASVPSVPRGEMGGTRSAAEATKNEERKGGMRGTTPNTFLFPGFTRTCASDVPEELRDTLSDYQQTAYYHIRHRIPCTLLLSRACRDFEQFLDEERYYRQRAVKEAMQHAWRNYERYAFGSDELLPLTGEGKEGWGGYALTLVDSLDTLLVMNMEEEYNRARAWILRHLNFDGTEHPLAELGLSGSTNVNFFEMSIRVLGGLLGAYALKKDKALLRKASDVGKLLSRAFRFKENFLPFSDVDLVTGTAMNKGQYNSLAEAYIPLEWKFLAEETNRCQYSKNIDRIRKLIKKAQLDNTGGVSTQFLWPNGQSVNGSTNTYSFGARADSFYEYILKEYLWDKRPDPEKRKIYDMLLRVIDNFVVSVGKDKAALIELNDPPNKKRNLKRDMSIPKMDHLVCFLPGVFALDEISRIEEKSAEEARNHTTEPKFYTLAEQLTSGCYEMYNRTATKVAPEITRIGNSVLEDDTGSMHNLLRPETLESVFLMSLASNRRNEASKQIKYENWGWDIFQAFQTHTRVRYGYAGLKNVQNRIPDNATYEQRKQYHMNTMPSFFIAETLKYAYLLFENKEVTSELLNTFLLTTEAHFIPKSSGKCDDTVDPIQQPTPVKSLLSGRRGDVRPSSTKGFDGPESKTTCGCYSNRLCELIQDTRTMKVVEQC